MLVCAIPGLSLGEKDEMGGRGMMSNFCVLGMGTYCFASSLGASSNLDNRCILLYRII